MAWKSVFALAIAASTIVGCGSSEPGAKPLAAAPKTAEPAAGTAPQSGDTAQPVAAPSND